MILSETTQTLQLVLAGAIATKDLDWSVTTLELRKAYANATSYTPDSSEGKSADTADVDMAGPPAANFAVLIEQLFIRNTDTASAVVSVKHDTSGTDKTIFKFTMAAGDVFCFVDGDVPCMIDSNGSIKTVAVGGLSPSGTASGDLDGTYPAPTLKILPRTSVVLATTATLLGTYANGTAGVGATLTLQNTFTGNTHTTTVVDGIASTTGLVAGMGVSGSGVQVGSLIFSVDSANQITLTLPTSTTVSSNSLTFYRSALTADGATAVLNDSVLIKDQTSGLQSGHYTVTTVGNPSTPTAGVLTRSTTMDEGKEFPARLFYVTSGTTNGGTTWRCTNAVSPTVGTTAITFTSVAGGGSAGPVRIPEGGSSAVTAVGAIDNFHTQSTDIASASPDLSAATGDYVNITGTTTITSFGTMIAGVERTLTFTGALILTHNATSLILPGAANITTAANDVAIFRSLGSGNWICISYMHAAFSPYTDSHVEGLIGGIIADTSTVEARYVGTTPEIYLDVRYGYSITADANGLKLSGDVAVPDAFSIYAVDGNRVRGWYPASTLKTAAILINEVADKTVGNTGTESTLLAAAHTFTSANLSAGTYLRVTMGGAVSMQNVAGQVVTLRLKMGSTVLGEVALTGTNFSNIGWRAEITVCLRTLGSPGTSTYSAISWYTTIGTTTTTQVNRSTSTPTTAGNPALDVAAVWTTGNINNTITTTTLLVEQIG